VQGLAVRRSAAAKVFVFGNPYNMVLAQAVHAPKVLQIAMTSNLPVQVPTKFELVIDP
jgi:hypothetical protein